MGMKPLPLAGGFLQQARNLTRVPPNTTSLALP